ncbi:MAG TPA: Cu(I)-responsive transcriptional regulator [Methylibium sp.]|nr:Cu(I)-responsive transcriptional regulator [Methylibium sp.]
MDRDKITAGRAPGRPKPAGVPSGDRAPQAPEGPTLHIGEAAARSGVSAKMVRHYESLGLLPEVPRTDAGYRRYGAREVHTLRFIRRARDLGFGIEEIRTLLALWQDHGRPSREVKRVALAHAADLQRRIDELQAMQRTLTALAGCCRGDQRADCPILDDLEAGPR